MSLSLHSALIPSMIQITDSVAGMLDKASNWCAENNVPEEELVKACLIEDMLPFTYQVKSVWVHSALAIECCFAGEFQPNFDPPPEDFDAMRALLADNRAKLEAVDADALEGIAGNDMVFAFKDKFRREYTVRDFLLSFSQPNFYFHASTAYGVLRMNGVPVGKNDFLGKTRGKA